MTSKKKRLITNIIFYTVLVIIYTIGIYAVVTKFNGGVVYLGNIRFDTILTDSMSSRNPETEEFLKDTTQLQVYDVVVSEKINDNTDLKVKDCVIFNSKSLKKTVCHRIVSISEEGIEFTVKAASIEKPSFLDKDLLYLTPGGTIRLGLSDFTDVEIVAYTDQLYDTGYYAVYLPSKEGEKPKPEPCEVVTEKIDNYYKHTITYHREFKQTSSNTIRCLNVDKKYIEKVTYKTYSNKTYVFNATDFVPDEMNNFKKYFDGRYLYEIRADKAAAADTDGVYRRDQIDAKVINILPKAGYINRFLLSIPGLILIVGLAVIITVASFFLSKDQAKKKKLEASSSGNIVDQPVETKDDDSDKGSGG